MINRIIAPESKSVDTVNLLRPERISLPNGIELYVLNGGDQELVRLEWIFENAAFNVQKPMLNLAVSGMLLEGTAQHTAAQLSEKIDFYGAFLLPEYSADHTSLALYTLNKHVYALLPLVKEVLTQAVFPEKELATYSRNNQQKLRVSLRKNDFTARRLFNQDIFRATKYGYVPEVADYEQLNREELLAAYSENFQPANCTLVMAGKITDELIDTVTDIFGHGWPAHRVKPAVAVPVFGPADTRLRLEERPDSLQSAIRLGNRTIQRAHPDFAALQVVNTLFGGYFGSRLMMNIREDKGYTYGIGSGIASLKHGAFFTIATQVGVSATAATLTEITNEMDRLHTELVSEEELGLVKNYMLGSLLGSLENIFSHADKFKNAYFSGLDLGYYDRYTMVIKQITPGEVQETAQKYLQIEHMVKIVVGKM